MFERFTTAARDVVVRAQQEARELRHPVIGTEHLLLALLDPAAQPAYGVLAAPGLDRARIRADVERLVPTASRPLTEEDAAALRTVGIDLDAVLAKIEETLGPDALDPPTPPERRGLFRRRRPHGRGGHLPFSPRAKKVLELALREALHLNHRHIGTEHILLGLLREGGGLAGKVLADAGVDLAELRRAMLAALPRAA